MAPAVTFLKPSWTMAWARTVAVVVPSPAMSLVLVAASLSSWRHVLEWVLQLDLFGDGHTVVGNGWWSEFLVEDHVAALRTSVILTASAKLVNTRLSARRASSLYSSCLAGMCLGDLR